VRVVAGESSWEIFEIDFRDELERRSLEAFTIECPSSRVAEDVQLRKEQWRRRGAYYYQSGSMSRLEIDAGNFGCIAWPPVVSSKTPQEAVPRHSEHEATRVWIDGLIARAAGASAHLYLANRSLAMRDFPWLYPYLCVLEKAPTGSP